MNTTITSNGLPVLPQAKGNAQAPAQSNAPAAEATATPQTGDSVKLTESARTLHAVAQGDQGTGIDAARVAEIRQKLADGSYTINAGKIADGLISLEGQISGQS